MTDIEFDCPFCSRPMKVPSSAAGKSGKCKTCKNTVVVPKPRPLNPATAAQPVTQKWWSVPRWILVLLAVLFLPIIGFAVWSTIFGTDTRLWTEKSAAIDWHHTDTISKWSGKVVFRKSYAFMSDDGTFIATLAGPMDDSERQHGKWTRTAYDGDVKLHYFWHGDTCSEEQFQLRTEAAD